MFISENHRAPHKETQQSKKHLPGRFFAHLQTAALVCLWLLGAAACGQLNPTPAPTETPVATSTLAPTLPPTPAATSTPTILQGTVTLWHSWPETDVPALVQIISDFQQQYPNVQFDVLYIPFEDLQARFQVATREGGGPSLLLGPSTWGPSLDAAGYLADLSGVLDEQSLAALNTPALASGQAQERLISLPANLQGVVLYRNKALVPEAASTLDDMKRVSANITQGETFGAFLERGFQYSGGHLIGIGGTLLNSDGSPGFEEDRGDAWVYLLQEFDQLGLSDFMTDQDLDRFKAGQVGWIIDGTWNIKPLIETLGPEKLAIDSWPDYKEGQLAGFVQSENFYLSSRAAGDELAVTQEFLRYFFSTQAQAVLVNVGRIPANTQTEISDPILAQAATALQGGVTYPTSPAFGAYAVPMDQALKSIFVDGVPPEEALRAAAEAIRLQLANTTPTPAP